ncbi:type I polyketide synthase [Mycobacterium simulans]
MARSAAVAASDSLFQLHWPPLPETFPPAGALPSCALISGNAQHLPAGLRHLPTYPDLTHPELGDTELVIWALPATDPHGDPLQQVRTLTEHTLTGLQHWLTRPDTLNTPLAILTRYAVATSTDDHAPDLAHAAIWALVHTAQNEHPGRITLVDTDESSVTDDTLRAAASARLGTEPQLALRKGIAHVPRLTRRAGELVASPTVFDPEGTVLITGGTGMLGGLFAEHLVTEHGVRHLLLVSRRGPDSPGAADLLERLIGFGAQVQISACDTSSPAQLGALLASLPAAHRLSAVIHTAGVLHDALVSDLTGEHLDVVLSAKADTAWHLHQLTAGMELDAFVVFSSVAGILGPPGQANYAAANAFLDALARQRHQQQLPATSLAWGFWQTLSDMTAHLSSHDQARLARNSLAPITTDRGLAIFDAAMAYPQPNLIASPVNAAALARQARGNTLAPILSALTTARPQAAAASPDTLTARLASQTPDQQRATLTALVTATTATVLAHPDPDNLNPDRPFKDLGIDSLTALELRNALTQHTGLTLPATLTFDHPTPTALAQHLITQLTENTGDINSPTDIGDADIQRLIASIPVGRLRAEGILDLLLGMVGQGEQTRQDRNKISVPDLDLDGLVDLILDED